MPPGPPSSPNAAPAPYTGSPPQRLRFPLVLPPPVHDMAPTTDADRATVQTAFQNQYHRIETLKIELLASEEGAECQRVSQDFLDSIVRAWLP